MFYPDDPVIDLWFWDFSSFNLFIDPISPYMHHHSHLICPNIIIMFIPILITKLHISFLMEGDNKRFLEHYGHMQSDVVVA